MAAVHLHFGTLGAVVVLAPLMSLMSGG